MSTREKLTELIFEIAPYGMSEMFAVHLADHLLANGVRLESKQATSDESKRWISVTERLPKSFEDVLVCDATGGFRDVCYLEGGKSWVAHAYRYELDDVTHWMPLPEPPRTP